MSNTTQTKPDCLCRSCGAPDAYLGRLDVAHEDRIGKAEKCAECHEQEDYERTRDMRDEG